MRTPVKGQSGFTLIEVLVALTILSVGLLAIANLQFWAIYNSNTANVNTVAAMVGQGALEEILSLEDNDETYFGSSMAAPAVWSTANLTGSGQYMVTYQITVHNPALPVSATNPVPNVARIDITVTGAGRQFTLIDYKRTSI